MMRCSTLTLFAAHMDIKKRLVILDSASNDGTLQQRTFSGQDCRTSNCIPAVHNTHQTPYINALKGTQ